MRALARAVGSMAVLAIACVPPGVDDGTRRPRAGIKGGEVHSATFKPTGPRAEHYGARVQHRLGAVEAAILGGLKGSPAQHDPALSRAIRDLASSTPSRFDMPPALMDGLLAWNGLVDPPPQVMVVELDDDRCLTEPGGPCADPVAALVDESLSALDGAARPHVGVGVATGPSGRVRLMLGLVDRAVDLRAPPSMVGDGETFTVEGKLLGDRTNPDVHVVEPGGGWTHVPTVKGTDGTLAARVSCDRGPGPYKVEVLAEGTHGPEVVANFPVWCGQRLPPVIEFEVERLRAGATAGSIEQANFDYLNAARLDAGLPPLKWDKRVAAVSRAHSKDMVNSGFVGHVSPSTGDAAARLAKAGIEGVIVRENVARGYGPRGIHQSLMNSPGHRANIIATDVTHVGIGVVFGEPEGGGANAPRPVFLTQKFYATPGSDAPKNMPAGLIEGVDAYLAQRRVAAVDWDPRLSQVAQEHVSAVARGRAGIAPETFRDRVFALGYQEVARHQVVSNRWQGLVELDLWGSVRGQRVGFGVDRMRDGSGYLLVILVAK